MSSLIFIRVYWGKNVLKWRNYVRYSFILGFAFKPKVPENKLSSSPVVVVAGPQSRFLPQTLDTLALQGGLVRENVLVFHETDDLKAQDLCELFNFSCQLLQSDLSGGRCELLGQAMDTTETIYPDAPYMTIIEPDVLLGSDFLSFASAMASLLDADSTIGSVSGFNPDGSHLLAKDPSQAYRSVLLRPIR
ncbi:hypothetical protein BIW11_08713 [Tropilaelaps mercedesae]|uniref:Uncharacterized protein n=1 Tax=Tropilaelaps mercedesae TaxID=418985 RepID=A0A1V9XNL9_9ACAR|nr:hypothetical protein BIW11_08713 [Tropilaelaps mercedesae]